MWVEGVIITGNHYNAGICWPFLCPSLGLPLCSFAVLKRHLFREAKAPHSAARVYEALPSLPHRILIRYCV